MATTLLWIPDFSEDENEEGLDGDENEEDLDGDENEDDLDGVEYEVACDANKADLDGVEYEVACDANEADLDGDEVELDLEGNPVEVNKYESHHADENCDGDEVGLEVEGNPVEVNKNESHHADENCEEAADVIVAADKLKNSLDSEWVISIRERQEVRPRRLTTSSSRKLCSIHRVPHCIRQHNEKAYDPQIISIGPFHYEKRQSELQSMEEHKWRYLKDILHRGEPDLLERCLLAIRKLEKKARKCYSEKVDLDSNPFVEMLVLDGFFIIELFCRSNNKDDDPILKLGWLKSAIKMDLLLLENQIPFFVLESLCKEMGILEFDTFLMKWVAPTENAPNSTKEGEKENAPTADTPNVTKKEEKENAPTVDTPNVTKKEEKENATKFQHLLHFLHGLHLPNLVDAKPTRRKLQIIPNASRLQEAGIKFDMGPGSDIKFEKGVIKIPPLKVKDATKSVLLNLVAFEQCYRHCNSHFAGYTYFMDCLIDNAKDVQILCENGIIHRWLSSDQEVAALFNKMGREIILYDHDSNLLKVCEEINRYYGASWHAWRTSLKRNYFNNPWTIISVAAAIVLLLFTFSQTFFTAFPKFAAGN